MLWNPSFWRLARVRTLHFWMLKALSTRRQTFVKLASSCAIGITVSDIMATVSPSWSIRCMILSPSSAAFSARCRVSGSLALSAAPRCWTILLEIAEMSEPLSMGVIPTETMVLGMLVILESHPISTFCG